MAFRTKSRCAAAAAAVWHASARREGSDAATTQAATATKEGEGAASGRLEMSNNAQEPCHGKISLPADAAHLAPRVVPVSPAAGSPTCSVGGGWRDRGTAHPCAEAHTHPFPTYTPRGGRRMGAASVEGTRLRSCRSTPALMSPSQRLKLRHAFPFCQERQPDPMHGTHGSCCGHSRRQEKNGDTPGRRMSKVAAEAHM
jgi:hypothetical protein